MFFTSPTRTTFLFKLIPCLIYLIFISNQIGIVRSEKVRVQSSPTKPGMYFDVVGQIDIIQNRKTLLFQIDMPSKLNTLFPHLDSLIYDLNSLMSNVCNSAMTSGATIDAQAKFSIQCITSQHLQKALQTLNQMKSDWSIIEYKLIPLEVTELVKQKDEKLHRMVSLKSKYSDNSSNNSLTNLITTLEYKNWKISEIDLNKKSDIHEFMTLTYYADELSNLLRKAVHNTFLEREFCNPGNCDKVITEFISAISRSGPRYVNLFWNNNKQLLALSEINTYVFGSSIVWAVKMPLKVSDYDSYKLIKPIPLPIKVSESDGLYMYIKPVEYLMESNRENPMHRKISSTDLQRCEQIANSHYICPQMSILHNQEDKSLCDYALYQAEIENSYVDYKNCDIRIAHIANSTFFELYSTNSWLYIAPGPMTHSLQCGNVTQTNFDIQGTGMLTVDHNCVVKTDSVRLFPRQKSFPERYDFEYDKIRMKHHAFTRAEDVVLQLSNNRLKLEDVLEKAKELTKFVSTRDGLFDHEIKVVDLLDYVSVNHGDGKKKQKLISGDDKDDKAVLTLIGYTDLVQTILLVFLILQPIYMYFCARRN